MYEKNQIKKFKLTDFNQSMRLIFDSENKRIKIYGNAVAAKTIPAEQE